MSAYANRYTKSRIHFAIRLSMFVRVLQDRSKTWRGPARRNCPSFHTECSAERLSDGIGRSVKKSKNGGANRIEVERDRLGWSAGQSASARTA